MAHPKHAAADHEILDLIRTRWSPRAYDRSRPIDDATLLRLIEAARWAPSSRNEQPWRFVVVDARQDTEIHAALVATLSTGNQAWAPHAPMLIAVCVKMVVGDTPEANRHAYYDTGHAVALLTLQAQSLGLGVRQMEGFDRSMATSVLGVPGDHEIAVLMAVGYPGAPETLAMERHRELEVTPRTRRSALASVFRGVWNQT